MNAWQQRADDYSLVQCSMLYSLEPGLQKRFEKHGAYKMFEVQQTERCIKDISLLRSNEDNPQFTDLVRIIATINFQLNFL